MSDRSSIPADPSQASGGSEAELLGLLLKKIPASADRHQLEQATLAALQLILRRTGDQGLIDDLRARTALATATVPESGLGDGGELAHAAEQCVKIFHRGLQERKPREAVHDVPHGHRDGGQRGRKVKSGRREFLERALAVCLLAGCAAIGAWLFWQSKDGPRHSAADLVNQMTAAAQGAKASVHVFGGPLTVTKDGTLVSVTAEKVPADICVSASWALIRKGVVAIDGTTPPRVTATQLSELCHEREGGATLLWSIAVEGEQGPPPPQDPSR